MTVTDWLAIYGALLGTALAVWDVIKSLQERTKLRLNCYLAEEYTPGVGKTASNLLAYNIANVGGRPVVVTTIGGQVLAGAHFMVLQSALPKTLQPGEAMVLSAPLPENIKSIQSFFVWDAVGNKWEASPEAIWHQLQTREK